MWRGLSRQSYIIYIVLRGGSQGQLDLAGWLVHRPACLDGSKNAEKAENVGFSIQKCRKERKAKVFIWFSFFSAFSFGKNLRFLHFQHFWSHPGQPADPSQLCPLSFLHFSMEKPTFSAFSAFLEPSRAARPGRLACHGPAGQIELVWMAPKMRKTFFFLFLCFS